MEQSRRTVNAAVQYILDEGDPASGRPFRAVISGRAGGAEGDPHDGAMLLISARRYDVQPGDSIALAATFRPNPNPALPPLVLDDTPEPLHNRVQSLFAHARITAHGQTAPGAARPAAAALSTSRRPYEARGEGLGVTVVRRTERSADPVIRWAAAMIGGLKPDGSVVIVDPLAFTPPPPDAAPATDALSLRDALPETLREIADGITEASAVGLMPLLWPAEPDRRALGASEDAVLIPYCPYTTATTDWQSLTGLPIHDFAPRAPSDPSARRMFIAAHESAHAVQERYGIPPPFVDPRLQPSRNAAATNLSECFADGFATIACYQEDRALAPHLSGCAKERWASLLTTDLGHATSSAINRMLDLCERLDRRGLLDRLTPDRMARMAARNARRTALTAPAIDRINEARAAVLGGSLAEHLRTQDGPPPAIAIEAATQCFSIYQDRIEDPAVPISSWARGMLRKALACVEEVAWTPHDLEDPGARWAASRVYAADLARSASVLRGRPDAIALLHEVESSMNDAGPTPLAQDRQRLIEASRQDAAREAAEAQFVAPAATPVTVVRSRHDPAALREAFRRLDADPAAHKPIVLASYCDLMRREIAALDRAHAGADPAAIDQANRLLRQRAASSLAMQADPALFQAIAQRLAPDHAAHIAQGVADGRVPYDPAGLAGRRDALADAYGAITAQRLPGPQARIEGAATTVPARPPRPRDQER